VKVLDKIIVPKVDLQGLTTLDEQGFEVIAVRNIGLGNYPSGVSDLLAELAHEVLVKCDTVPALARTGI
jgi:hypothetical protein